ncbi:hypothetical protein [Streptomyces sp. NPDC005017]|uniref:hypothetical protein n=1 Tax=Streptomyces sp. NPDC005017 TaxID=3364706 RepID=UPI00368A9BEC
MPGYQVRDTATGRLDDELERDLAANGERIGRIRPPLDIEQVTDSATQTLMVSRGVV